jgi:hypothetical protein
VARVVCQNANTFCTREPRADWAILAGVYPGPGLLDQIAATLTIRSLKFP